MKIFGAGPAGSFTRMLAWSRRKTAGSLDYSQRTTDDTARLSGSWPSTDQSSPGANTWLTSKAPGIKQQR
jgi:hypothetical protein